MKQKSSKLIRSILTMAMLAVGVIYVAKNYNNSQSTTADDSDAYNSSQLSLSENNGADSGVDCLQCMEIPVIMTHRSEQLIQHLGYTLSFNPEWNIPNWVAYELTADEVVEGGKRYDNFNPDPLVKGDPVVTRDYSNSNFDRGHMAPAADFKWSQQAEQESYYMTNMCPQCHNLNAGDWNDLEKRVRELAKKYKSIYICCGPIVNNTNTTIGKARKIVVPQAFFKAILFKNGKKWNGVGFVFNNNPKDGRYGLEHYETTINQLEQITKMDFFSSLPDDVEEQIESAVGIY